MTMVTGNMKKKIVVFSTIIMLIVIILTPCISATLLEGRAIESEKSVFYGRVSGMITNTGFPPLLEISGAKLVLEGGLFKRITFSGIWGIYGFNFVPVGRQYNLTVSHPEYKTESTTFYLSPVDPFIIISFSLYEKETSRTTIDEPTDLGSIWGNTGTSSGTWGFSPVGLVKVEAGGKITTSSPIMGFHKIRNLPLGTYTVTGIKKGYDTFTETVKLTERHPDKQVFIHMEPNDENVKEKININTIKLTISNKELPLTGFIFGKTSELFEHAAWALPFVKLVTHGKTVYSGLGGRYILNGLELGYTYEIIASKPVYYDRTYYVELTADEPYKYQNIDLMFNHEDSVESVEKTNTVRSTINVNNKETACFRTIIGKTGTYMWSGWCPINYVKVIIGI